jgi:hypothetical protein
MFTFFPAVNEFYWGWVPMSNDLGPGMYWYGWLATATAFSGLLSMVITRLIPEKSHYGFCYYSIYGYYQLHS